MFAYELFNFNFDGDRILSFNILAPFNFLNISIILIKMSAIHLHFFEGKVISFLHPWLHFYNPHPSQHIVSPTLSVNHCYYLKGTDAIGRIFLSIYWSEQESIKALQSGSAVIQSQEVCHTVLSLSLLPFLYLHLSPFY